VNRGERRRQLRELGKHLTAPAPYTGAVVPYYAIDPNTEGDCSDIDRAIVQHHPEVSIYYRTRTKADLPTGRRIVPGSAVELLPEAVKSWGACNAMRVTVIARGADGIRVRHGVRVCNLELAKDGTVADFELGRDA
jgi:hypothetical protein